MRKTVLHILWSLLAVSMLFHSCDTTSPEKPKFSYTITLTHSAQQDTIYADMGLTKTLFTATLLDENNAPVTGVVPVFTWSQGSISFVNDEHETDSNGRVYVEFNDDGYASECTSGDQLDTCTAWNPVVLTVTYTDQYENSAAATDHIVVLPLATQAQTMTLITSASALGGQYLYESTAADSTYNIELNAYVRDAGGLGVENLPVYYEFDEAYEILGILSANMAVTNTSGKATITLTIEGQEVLAQEAIGTIRIHSYIQMAELLRVMEENPGRYDIPETNELNRTESSVDAEADIAFITVEDYYSNLVESIQVSATPQTIEFLDEFPDSIYASTIRVTVKDSDDAEVQHVPIRLSNLSVNGVTIGSVSPVYQISDEAGQVESTYRIGLNAFNGEEKATVRVRVHGGSAEGYPEVEQDIFLQTEQGGQAELVRNFNSWLDQGEILWNNTSIGISDTIFARITDESGGALSGVPVHYTKSSPTGYFSASTVLSDTTGLAVSVFYANPGEIPAGTTETIEFITFVNDEYRDTMMVNIDVRGVGNVNDVVEFGFTTLNDTVNVLTYGTLEVVAKDDNAVGVSNIPVRFRIDNGPGTFANGILETHLVYTSEPVDSLDDVAGFAEIGYSVLNNGIDKLYAWLEDPITGNILHEDFIHISAVEQIVLPQNLVVYPSAPVISVTNLDSTYIDTLYAIAQNALGGGIPGIVINFDMDDNDLDYGFLTPSSSVITDSVGVAKAYFESSPNIIEGVDSRDIHFTISTQDQDNAQSEELAITFQNNIPDCPDCRAEFRVWPEYEVLPWLNEDTQELETQTIIYAAYVDSLGFGPAPNSIVTFDSFEDSAGTWLDFGNVDEVGFFNTMYAKTDLPPGYFENSTGDSLLVATANFYMGNDAGLANIIGEYESMGDTTHVLLNSTYAAFIELIDAEPNEIMVVGGGGIETTEINARIVDSNGNTVSDPYQVRFSITFPAPSGCTLNDEYNPGEWVSVESANGYASVTLNSGTFPGAVRIRTELYEIGEMMYDETTMIAYAQNVMTTVITGPPAYGEINFATSEISPISGGNYQLPLSVNVWDLHANPVKDSTSVWLTLYEAAELFSPDSTYTIGDFVIWGPSDDLPMDSLVYNCQVPVVPPVPTPGEGVIVDGTPIWAPRQHPCFIVAEHVLTGEPSEFGGGDAGNAFQGIAWSALYYTSNPIFGNIIVKAQAFDDVGNYLVIDSRFNHNFAPTMLPFQPGQIVISADVQFWDFTTFPNEYDQGGNGCTTGLITVTARLQDFYSENIDGGLLQLTAIGGIYITPNQAITDANGMAQFQFVYNIAMCQPEEPELCQDPCEQCQYEDYTSTVWVDLLYPVATTSNQLEITLVRSGGECMTCPPNVP